MKNKKLKLNLKLKKRKRKNKRLKTPTKKNYERSAKIRNLEAQLKAKDKEIKAKDEELDDLRSAKTSFEKIFNQDQIKKIRDPTRLIHWLPETIQTALQMYVKLGTNVYNDLRDKIPAYPHVTTLRSHIKALDTSPGVQKDILKLRLCLTCL